MSFLVYGAGAVGGVIAGSLALAGVPTAVVARGRHLEQIRSGGLILDRHDGRHAIDLPAHASAAEVDWSDPPVVLLAVKSHQTLDALADLAEHAPHDATVVSVQNGVANERELVRRYAAAYSVCVMLPATHLEAGVVVQKTWPTPGILDVGRAAGGVDARCEEIAERLRAGGFVSQPRADISAWKHRKLLMNLGNGVDAVCRPGPDADELVERAQAEGARVLDAAGITFVSAEEDRARRGDLLRRRTDDPAPAGGSTWQSLTRGLAGEIDYLAGEIVLQARIHGASAPVNALIQETVHRVSRSGAEPRSVDPAHLLTRVGAC